MGIMMLVSLLAGLGIFMVGMKMMSDSMEKLADDKLRNLFNKVSGNRLIGVGIGLGSTVIVQSSSATTVMVVGFVNAGVITLTQAAAIIMGANIGTTITAQIAALQAFSITEYITMLAFVGVMINMFSRNDRVKTVGQILAGLGMLFIGLAYMSSAMSGLRDNEMFSQLITSISNPFILLLIGALFTALVQSSSAVTGILVAMVGSGIVIGGVADSNAVLFIIIGTNIGTCITALLSMIGTNSNAKRAAMIHLLFNVIGATAFFIILLFWPSFMSQTFGAWFDVPETQIAMFHTFFNILTTLMLLPFMNGLVALSKIMIRDKDDGQAMKLQFIDDRMLRTPSLAVAQLIKEITRMGHVAEDGMKLSINGIISSSLDDKPRVMSLKGEVEWLTQRVTQYLVKVSGLDLSYHDELTVSSMYHVISDIERISDFSFNFIRYTETIISDGIQFSESVNNEISEMHSQLKILFRDSLHMFERRHKGLMPDIQRRENQIDAMKKEYIATHIKRLSDGVCKASSSSIFINLISNMERLGDHLCYIAESVVDEV